MGAVNDIFAKPPEQVNLQDIEILIKEKREEARNLEYKSPQILEKPADLSEWISAFLNADGGLIILGLCENDSNKKSKINAKIYPEKTEFVGSEYTKERIEQLIFNNIGCSSKPDIRIYPIRDIKDLSHAIYLIEIPQGDNPPYQAQNKKYYRRLNSTKYEMPHSEIADFFGRRRRPKLIVTCRIIDPKRPSNSTMKKAMESNAVGVVSMRSSYRLQLILSNLGKAAAKHARVVASFENIDIVRVISGPNHRIDDLRNGLPTLQWDNPSGIIYADSRGGDVVWDLQIRLHKMKAGTMIKIGTIIWEAQAEEMDYAQGKYVFHGLEFADIGKEITPYWLPKNEDFWNGKSDSTKVLNEDENKEAM